MGRDPDSYADPRRTGLAAFLAGGRAFGGRILRLALLGLVVSHVLRLVLGPDKTTANVTAADVAALAAAFFLQLCIQLAQVRTIVEDRRSVLFALAAGWRLLAARPLTVLGLYVLVCVTLAVGVTLALALALVTVGSVGRNEFGWPDWFLGQLVTTALVWFDLQTSASLIALYQAEMLRLRPEPAPAEASSGLSRLNALTAKE